MLSTACNNTGPVPLGDQAHQATAGALAGGDVAAAAPGGYLFYLAGERAASNSAVPHAASNPGSASSTPTTGAPTSNGVPAASPGTTFCSAYKDFTNTNGLSGLSSGDFATAKAAVDHLLGDARKMAAKAPAEIKVQAAQLAAALGTLDAIVRSSTTEAQVVQKSQGTSALKDFASSGAAVAAYGDGHC